MNTGVRLHALALGAYTGFAAILLHPLWMHNGTHVAGYDWFNYNWNFWWIRQASAMPGLNIYLNDFVMFPAMSNYGYHALTPFWYPAWVLIEPWAGTFTAVNVIITLMCVLNGYILFAWLRSERVAPGLALLGGVILQTLPISRYFYYNTHLNLGDWFWLPGLLLMWKWVIGRVELRSLVRAGVFGVALWGLLLTDLQMPIFAAGVVAPYGLLTLALGGEPGSRPPHPRDRWRIRRQIVGCGLVAVAVGVALMWFAGPLPSIARFQGELVPGPVADRPGIPFPAGFLTMAADWWQWDHPSLGVFFPLALAGTVVVGARLAAHGSQLTNWFWLIVALPPLIFALGPFLNGNTDVPLPFIWLYNLTDGMFRMPWRLAPIGVISGVTFMGLVWTRVIAAGRAEGKKSWTTQARRTTQTLRMPQESRTTQGSSVQLVMVGAVVACTWAVRLFETRPLDPVLPHYDFYEAMGAERGVPHDDYVVIDAPTGMGTGEVLLGNQRAIQYQYYGMLHGKRMVNGFISRAPVEQFFYIETGDPLLSWLGQRVPLDPAAVEASLRERIDDWPIGYIVLHTDDIGRNTATPQEIIGYFNQLDDLVCPMWIEGAAVVYRTRWHPDGCPARTPPEVERGAFEIDLGAAGDERFIGWGWHWQEDVGATRWRWAGEYPEARLYVDVPPGAYRLTLAAQAFWEARDVRLRVNGEQSSRFTVHGSQFASHAAQAEAVIRPEGLQEVTFEIPAEAIGDGRHVEIVIVYDDVIVPSEVGQSADPRRLSIAVDWVRLTLVEDTP